MLSSLKEVGYGNISPIFPAARIIPLHIMLSGCGYSREDSVSYNWNGLKRGPNEFCIFQYTLSGRGEMFFEGETFELTKAKAFLVYVPHEHRYYLPANSDYWEFIYFSLVGHEAISIWRNVLKLCGPVIELSDNSKVIQTLADIYIAWRKHGLESPYKASLFGYELLMLLCEEVLPRSNLSSEPEFIENVISFCVKNIANDISIDDMACVAGLSRFHFSRLFKESQGMSPWEFLINLRMKIALRYIQTEALSVKEISEFCGFKDPSYFCKVFKKYFGASPEKFRTSR